MLFFSFVLFLLPMISSVSVCEIIDNSCNHCDGLPQSQNRIHCLEKCKKEKEDANQKETADESKGNGERDNLVKLIDESLSQQAGHVSEIKESQVNKDIQLDQNLTSARRSDDM